MKCKLGDIVEVTMGQSPKSEFYNADGKGTPFLQGNRTFGSKYPTFDTFTTFVTKQGRAGDVIMSVRAPVGDVNVTPVDICLGRGVCSLRMKNGSQEFLYYMMRHYAQALINRESGTVFGSVNKNDVNGLDVEVPSEETQRKIAAILSALDDKIELNRRINANLEQQAAAIFDSWLIRNIESGKTVSLDEVCAKVTDGSHFSPKDDSSSSIPMFSVKDMERYDFDFRSCKHISDADFEKMVANDCVPRINDILVAKDGSYLKEIFINKGKCKMTSCFNLHLLLDYK